MTENQRDYLADLAGKKGTRLFDTDNWSVTRASEEIEAMKDLPDAIFDEAAESEVKQIDKLTNNVLEELALWTFQK